MNNYAFKMQSTINLHAFFHISFSYSPAINCCCGKNNNKNIWMNLNWDRRNERKYNTVNYEVKWWLMTKPAVPTVPSTPLPFTESLFRRLYPALSETAIVAYAGSSKGGRESREEWQTSAWERRLSPSLEERTTYFSDILVSWMDFQAVHMKI